MLKGEREVQEEGNYIDKYHLPINVKFASQ